MHKYTKHSIQWFYIGINVSNNSYSNENPLLIKGLHEISFVGSFAKITSLQSIANEFCSVFSFAKKHHCNTKQGLLQTIIT